MNKKEKKIIAIVLIVILFGIVGLLFGIIQFSSLTAYGGPFPAYITITGTSSLTCNPISVYDKQFLPYLSKTNVVKVNSNSEIYDYSSNDAFEFYIFDSNGKSPRGMSYIEEVYQIGSGIPPNVQCDGTKDCLFGFTNEIWEYNAQSNLCFVKQEPVEVLTNYYRLSNNQCVLVNILPSQKTSNDYATFSECQSKITGIVCTADARLCPDGSYVGRVPPDCNFEQCPNVDDDDDDTQETLLNYLPILMFLIVVGAIIFLIIKIIFRKR